MRRLLLLLAFTTLSIPPATAQQRAGIDLSLIDSSVRPQDDFWRYANGKWLAGTEIPADRPGWDSFGIVRELTQTQLRDVLQAIDVKSANEERRKLADLYASFLDEATVEAAGLAGLKPELDRIQALTDPAALPALFTHLAEIWVRVPYFVDVGSDEHDATTYIVHLRQGRLGLPDRDYYLKDDAHFMAIRAAYRAHVAKLLSLAGVAASAADVDAVIALETSLAKLQWTRVQNRDPLKTYNKKDRAELPSYLTKEADRGAPRRADDVGSGLPQRRERRLGGMRGAGQRAEGHGRASPSRDGQGRAPSRREGTSGRAGLRAVRSIARRLFDPHPRGERQVGQADPRAEPQGGLSVTP